MKLFTKAGSTANMCILIHSTAYRHAKLKAKRELIGAICAGLLIAELIIYLTGMDAPWVFFSFCNLVLAVIFGAVILASVYKRHGIIIASTPEQSSHFMVSKRQILWITPDGEIPVFSLKGFKIKKEASELGEKYICYGKPGPMMRHKVQQLMVGEKVWACRKLLFMIYPDADEYPEAIDVLEAAVGEGK